MSSSASSATRSSAPSQTSGGAARVRLEAEAFLAETSGLLPDASGGGGLPPVVSRLDAAQIADRIAIWRATSAPLDSLFQQGAAPADALRRFGLTHWSMGNPLTASVILATAAALAPDDAALWLDLASTLHASGQLAEARPVFARVVALQPRFARGWLGLALVANALGDRATAERAFATALQHDPALSEAAFGLGLVCFEMRRYAEAVVHWRRALAAGSQNGLIHAGLGQALFFTGDFAGAARELGAQIASGLGVDQKLVRRFALARFLETIIAGDEGEAFAAYEAAAGAHAEDAETIVATAFSLLTAYGHRAAAIELGRTRRLNMRNDPIQRYLLDAVVGKKLDRAPSDYLIAHFDRFADTFDKQLVEVLGYDVPAKLASLVEAYGRDLPRALDLGCGTGLAGPLLRAGRERLVGVDLSSRMLAKAAERRVYDRLIEGEMIGFLEATEERFDLLFAADTLIYLGDLAAFLRGVARVATAGALFAFNIETTEEASYALLSSGRFAHSIGALRAKAAPWFVMREARASVLRSEANAQVKGSLIVLERRRG